jgi:hypothetical protein
MHVFMARSNKPRTIIFKIEIEKNIHHSHLVLTSFIMGLIDPAIPGHFLPWFRPDHPLQSNGPLIVGLKFGLCGCLTTCTLR